MPIGRTVEEELKKRKGRVVRGFSAYSGIEEVEWPLSVETNGPIIIRAIFTENTNGTHYNYKDVRLNDAAPEGVVWYTIYDFGHTAQDKGYEPTEIEFG